MTLLERFHAWKDRAWERFIVLAQGHHAIFWLGVCAMTDPIFFPIPPEIYLAALMLAHPKRWKIYFIVSITCSVLGSAIGYFIGAFLFHQFGIPLLHFYHLEVAFKQAQHLLVGHVLVSMILVAFQLIPEKVFVLAGGFLGLPFMPFVIGFFIGRAARIGITIYLTHRYGMHVLTVIKKYFFFFTILLLAFVAYYAIVHLVLVPHSIGPWHRALH